MSKKNMIYAGIALAVWYWYSKQPKAAA